MTIIKREDIGTDAQPYYIGIGQHYGSDETHKQLVRSLAAIDKYRDLMRSRGLTEALETLANNVRESLIAAGVIRADARTQTKITNAALLDAMDAGKKARRAAHAAFEGARLFLHIAGDKVVNDIDQTLHDTRSAGADTDTLARQLQQLVNLLTKAPLRTALGEAAAGLESQLNTSIAALAVAHASKTGTRGTPAETEYVDLLDGLAVVVARQIRKIGRVTADETGQPTIATECDLRELYKSTGRRAANDDTDTDTDTDAT